MPVNRKGYQRSRQTFVRDHSWDAVEIRPRLVRGRDRICDPCQQGREPVDSLAVVVGRERREDFPLLNDKPLKTVNSLRRQGTALVHSPEEPHTQVCRGTPPTPRHGAGRRRAMGGGRQSTLHAL